jgi:hypothetical protein
LVLVLRRRSVLALLGLLGACHHGAATGDLLNPIDSIGRTHDTKLFDGSLQIAAYDASFGDLAYGKVSLDSLDKPFDWILVDGNDPTAPSDATTPYRHKQTAPGPDVGYYAALAITSGGDPRIAYFDTTNGALRYARGGFPFETHQVEAGSSDGTVQVGMFPTIALDVHDAPILAYMASGLGDGTNGFRGEVHIATATSSSPQSASDWQIAVADSTPISCGGRCGSGTACVMKDMVGGKPNTNPAQSTCLTVDLAPCMPGCKSSQVCVQSMCKDVVAATTPPTLPDGTGLFAHLIRNPTDATMNLLYYDHSLGQLRLATPGPDGKLAPVVIDGGQDAATGGTADVGQFANGAFADDGTLHVAYGDAHTGELLYRSISPGGAPSMAEVVDDGTRDDGPHPVGASASVLVIGGIVSILYQDQGSSDLLLAQRSGGWTQRALRSGPEGSGFSSHLVGDGTKAYYSSWVFDRSMMPIGRLVLDAVAQ